MSIKQKLDIPHNNEGLVLTACFHDNLSKLVQGHTILDCTAAKDDGGSVREYVFYVFFSDFKKT